MLVPNYYMLAPKLKKKKHLVSHTGHVFRQDLIPFVPLAARRGLLVRWRSYRSPAWDGVGQEYGGTECKTRHGFYSLLFWFGWWDCVLISLLFLRKTFCYPDLPPGERGTGDIKRDCWGLQELSGAEHRGRRLAPLQGVKLECHLRPLKSII